jgi:histidinol dehydrogenase
MRPELTVHDWSALDDATRRQLLRRPSLGDDDRLQAEVRDILRRVREDGDAALRALTREFDGVDSESLRVDDEEFDQAERALSGDSIEAIRLAIDNVRRFHEARPATDYAVETMPGVRCERISHPIDAVGLYVPAGSAPLPSAAIMLAVPAAIAGCPRRVLCTPPRRDGRADPGVLVAACASGVREVYKVGGAQAIAAMAYGSGSVPAVDKIFGPGSARVTAAKTLVAAEPEGPAIDMPAGPSEVLVIADSTAVPAFVAADLLAQAEHGSDSQVVLVTTDRRLADDVVDEIGRQLPNLSRRDIASDALSSCRLVVVKDVVEAIGISNRYAPEHLILQIREARAILPQLRNAGSVFLGPWSPESVGDYCSGTNHVLPTHGRARAYSGLGVDQFMRHMTIQALTRDGLQSLAPTVFALAGLEGLDAHAAAVRCRLRAGNGGSA